MKIFIFLLFLTFLTGNLYGQIKNPSLILTEVKSDDELEHKRYQYNEDNLLEEIEVLYSDGVQAREVMHYEGVNVVKLDGYQLINGEWKQTYYVDYLYDGDGNRISRTNYNNFGGDEFELGGIYRYYYGHNRLVTWELIMMDEVVEKGDLYYDAQGVLLEEIAEDAWSTGRLQISWKEEYIYNSEGSLVQTIHSEFDAGFWVEVSMDEFTYNDRGNCINWEHLNDGMVTNRYEYEYSDDYSRNEILYPYSPEDDADPFRWVVFNDKLNLSHWYTLDDANNLIYVCDFLYIYDLLEPTEVKNADRKNFNFMVYPNPTTRELTVTSEGAHLKTVEVRDMSGNKAVQQSDVDRNALKLDVSHLSPGMYIVNSQTARGSFSRKVIVK